MAFDSKNFRQHLKRYLKASAGNVTMITALASLPLFLSAGAAIDYASMTRDIAAFQAAADFAVVAVVTSDKARITGLSGAADGRTRHLGDQLHQEKLYQSQRQYEQF